MLNRSYKGFFLWMAAFCGLIAALSFLPIEDDGLMVRIVDCACVAGIEGLMVIIWRTEKIFWINGVRYEDALEAGSARRKAYALKYVKLFGIFLAGFSGFSVFSQLLRLPYMADTVLLAAGILACAFGTMKFRL